MLKNIIRLPSRYLSKNNYLIYFTLLLIFLILGCSEEQTGYINNIDTFYLTKDEKGLVEFIENEHYRFRRLLDKEIYSILNERLKGFSGNYVNIEWFLEIYDNSYKIYDLRQKYNLYKLLTQEACQYKLKLDSIFSRETQAYVENQINYNEYITQLLNLSNEYIELNDSFHLSSVLYYLGDTYLNENELDSAKIYFDKSIKIASVINNFELLGNCYLKLADLTSVKKADYFNAELFLIKAEEYYERIGKQSNYLLFRRGYNYYNLGDIDRTIQFAKQSMPTMKSNNNFFNNLLSECYIDLKNYDSALFYANRYQENVKKTIKNEQNHSHISNLAYSLSTLGFICQCQQDRKLSLRFYKEANKYFGQAQDSTGLLLNLGRTADYYISIEEYHKAESLYVDIINQSKKFETTIESLFGLALTKYKMEKYDDAKMYLSNCISLVESLRKGIKINEMQSGLMTHRINYYDLLTDIYIQEYIDTKNSDKLDSALTLFEKKKARALENSLSGNNNVPSKDERQLIEEISHVSALAIINDDQSDSVKNILNIKKEQLYKVRLNNERNYNNIIQDQGRSYTIKEIIDGIKKNEVILQYQLSEYGIYVFILTQNLIDISIVPVSYDTITSSIEDLLGSISTYPSTSNLSDIEKEKLRKLYSLLIPPLPDSLQYNDLIIIPSKELHYLPMEVLLDKNDKYLIEKYNISYAPSLSIFEFLKNRSRKKTHSNKLIAIGSPIIPENNIFDDLNYSKQELDNIKKILGKENIKIYQGGEASEENIKNADLTHYDILHIASHSYCNTKNPDLSSIILSPDIDEKIPGNLNPDEIMLMSVPNDLVFLSACQTGTGKLLPGEGVMSLTKPFLIAGANNVVASYWNVDDFGTSKFVELFYTYLEDNHSVKGSLSLVKRRMINSNRPLLRHPYFWGAFVLTGCGYN